MMMMMMMVTFYQLYHYDASTATVTIRLTATIYCLYRKVVLMIIYHATRQVPIRIRSVCSSSSHNQNLSIRTLVQPCFFPGSGSLN